MPSRLQALLIDMDGTLCESEEVHRGAFNDAFAQAGLPFRWEPEEYGRLLAVKGGEARIRHFLRADRGMAEAEAASLARTLHAAKTARFTAAVREGRVAPRPGVLRLIGEARERGVRLAIVTSATLPTAAALVEGTLGPETAGWFETFCTGDAVAVNKPAPDLYALALKRLGLPPTACIALEDDPPGMAAATAAGIAVVVTPSAFTAGAAFPGARAVVPDLDAGPPDGPVTLARLETLLAGDG
jgi:HAD superfamily hydrolase (TIGR01509 family)